MLQKLIKFSELQGMSFEMERVQQTHKEVLHNARVPVASGSRERDAIKKWLTEGDQEKPANNKNCIAGGYFITEPPGKLRWGGIYIYIMFTYLSILNSQTVSKVLIITVLFSGKETEV